MNQHRSGLIAAIGAFFLWGVLPMYWKHIDFMASTSIVAHRTLWSLLILFSITCVTGELQRIGRQLRNLRTSLWLLLSGLLLASNWLMYVWATLNGRILEGALGYYLNPFLNMLFGFLWFGDRHNRRQLVAILLALLGTLLQMPALGHFPWLSLALATTFSLYAVTKKLTPLASFPGLAAETAMLSPLALAWLLYQTFHHIPSFGSSWTQIAWLAGSGIATTAPLWLFGHAARRIRLTDLGMIQFLGPSLQFLIGWLVYSEPMPIARLASFTLIWGAIALYIGDSMRRKPTDHPTIDPQ